MAFLQPIFLLALIAAGIPILLHLLSLRKLKVIPFSTLSFLKELQRSRVRAVRLKQLLLLLLRTVLVLLLVLAFARPAFRGTSGSVFGTTSATDAIFIIDDSYSMSARDAGGSFLRQAGDAAASVLDGFNENDHVLLLPFSGASASAGNRTGNWLTPAQAAEELRSIPFSPISPALGEVLRTASAFMNERTAPNREVFLFSDFQRGLALDTRGPETVFDAGVRITFIPVGDVPPENVSLSAVRLASSIVEVGQPSTFSVTVRNSSAQKPVSATASLFLETDRVDQRVSTLQPGEERELSLRFSPRRTGLLTGSIVLEGDDLEFDNTYVFALSIPEERDVLLIGDREDTRYVALALSSAQVAGRARFRVTTLPAERVTAADVRGNSVVILTDAPVRPDVRHALSEEIRSGKGLIVAPPRLDRSLVRMNEFLSEFGTQFRTIVQPQPGGGFHSFGRADLDHPLFEGMFSDQPTDAAGATKRILESPDVYSYAEVGRSGRGTPIISLSNGSPFLSEYSVGSGRMLAYSVAMVAEWSAFPFSGLFVPMMDRSVVYAAGDIYLRPSIHPGDEVTLPLRTEGSSRLRLRLPDTHEIAVQPTILPTGVVFRTRETTLPGVYSISSGEGAAAEVDRFTVNFATEESDMRRLTDDQLFGLSRGLGVEDERTLVFRDSEDLRRDLYESRVGFELWGTLLILALAVALAEMAVAGTRSQEPSPGVTA